MTCEEARELLHAERRGRLAASARAGLDRHLETCEACRRARDEELALDGALAKLPRFRVSPELRRALEEKAAPEAEPASKPRTKAPRARWVLGGAAGALAMAAAIFIVLHFVLAPRGDEMLAREVVNDHLRVLYSEHPIEIESGGIHQVKPWFAGRVDFAPTEVFAGDDEFVLQGGSVGYVIDRKAATFLYRHKLHSISLFVFPADGLPWPSATSAIGRARVHKETQRGFHVMTWRDGDLGYALVSDVNEDELTRLVGKILEPSP
jgi:anti-sigma factor RsiW